MLPTRPELKWWSPSRVITSTEDSSDESKSPKTNRKKSKKLRKHFNPTNQTRVVMMIPSGRVITSTEDSNKSKNPKQFRKKSKKLRKKWNISMLPTRPELKWWSPCRVITSTEDSSDESKSEKKIRNKSKNYIIGRNTKKLGRNENFNATNQTRSPGRVITSTEDSSDETVPASYTFKYQGRPNNHLQCFI